MTYKSYFSGYTLWCVWLIIYKLYKPKIVLTINVKINDNLKCAKKFPFQKVIKSVSAFLEHNFWSSLSTVFQYYSNILSNIL